MEKRSYPRFTTEEKRTILEETRQPGVTLAEVCRKHSVSPALVYQWRAVALQATTAALQQVDSRGKSQPDPQTARLLAEIELEAALSKCNGAKPRIVDDHGSEFCNSELRAVVKAHDLLDIPTRARHPESNGIVERFKGPVRQDSDDYYGDNYLQAEPVIARLIDEFNHVRLHAALGGLQPRELHLGNPEQRRKQRR